MQDRPDLALLHGGGQGSWVWEPTLAALRVQSDPVFRTTLALDVPGCGRKRGGSIEHLQPLDVAHQLLADLEAAGMRDVVLVGHSLAGNVLPRMLELRPELFRRLIYVSCSLPKPGQTVLQLMGGGLHGSDDDQVGWPVDPRTPLHERYDVMFCNDMSESQKTSFLASLEQDHWPPSFFTATSFDFTRLDAVPATYVVCLQDRILPVRWQEIFAQRFHAGRLVRIDAGHQVMITRPHALAEILRHEALS